MLSFAFSYCYAECRYTENHYTECHYAECHYAENHYTECHYAECRYAECRYAECHCIKFMRALTLINKLHCLFFHKNKKIKNLENLKKNPACVILIGKYNSNRIY
jgi:hypothetical protein